MYLNVKKNTFTQIKIKLKCIVLTYILFNLVIPLHTTRGSLSTTIVLLAPHFENHWFMSYKGNAMSSSRGGSRVSGYPGLSPETSIPVRIHFK